MPSPAHAASWASSPAVRRNMQANRRSGTGPELAVRRVLHAHGYRYRVDWPLPFDRRRRADIAFTRRMVVIFIDGCFWHRCPKHYVPPRSHSDYWERKTLGNSRRDLATTHAMRELGWTVMRFWAHEDPAEVAAQIADAIDAPRPL